MFQNDSYLTMRSAFLTAFPKIFTDIPYGTEMFQRMIKMAIAKGFSFNPDMFEPNLSLEIEARYKAVSNALKTQLAKMDNSVVVELGAGLSPRRLEFIKQKNYYELDYELIMEIKKAIYNEMGFAVDASELMRVNLSDEAIFKSKLDSIVQKHPSSSLVFISEGLFWYLSIDTLQKITEIIKREINLHGGCWIVGDTPVEDDVILTPKYRKMIAKSAKKDMRKPFGSILAFADFFTREGFSFEIFSLVDLVDSTKLVSGHLFSLKEDIIRYRLKGYTQITVLF